MTISDVNRTIPVGKFHLSQSWQHWTRLVQPVNTHCIRDFQDGWVSFFEELAYSCQTHAYGTSSNNS